MLYQTQLRYMDKFGDQCSWLSEPRGERQTAEENCLEFLHHLGDSDWNGREYELITHEVK